MSDTRPHLVCLDVEGVLTPEIWIAVAEKTQIPALRRTTRDEPNYDKLMRDRIAILKENKLKMADIQAVIRTLNPLEGAVAFLKHLRSQAPVILLSDTFYPFAAPLMEKLGQPVLFCNTLDVDAEGFIQAHRLRTPDQKRASVRALKSLNFRVSAAGDSYNDISMLEEADSGIFFRPPGNVIKDYPHLPVATTYEELIAQFERIFRA